MPSWRREYFHRLHFAKGKSRMCVCTVRKTECTKTQPLSATIRYRSVRNKRPCRRQHACTSSPDPPDSMLVHVPIWECRSVRNKRPFPNKECPCNGPTLIVWGFRGYMFGLSPVVNVGVYFAPTGIEFLVKHQEPTGEPHRQGLENKTRPWRIHALVRRTGPRRLQTCRDVQ